MTKRVASTASVAYSFCMRHRPGPSEPIRAVKLSGAAMTAFPMALHEFAYMLPNSTFQSAGSAWGSVSYRPTFTSNRTVATRIRGADDNFVDVPPHEFSMTSDANCRLEFRGVDLATIPESCGELYSRTSFAYAQEVTSRFSWAATERTRRELVFDLKRNSMVAPSLELSELSTNDWSTFAPHEVSLSNLDYDLLQDGAFRASMLALLPEGERTIFTAGLVSDPLPHDFRGEGQGAWENDAVYGTITTRLRKWNDTMKTLDMSEEPHFRRGDSNARKEDADDRLARVMTEQAQSALQDAAAAQPQASTAPEGPSKDETTHAFFRATNIPRNKSTLIRCKVSVIRYKSTSQQTTSDRADASKLSLLDAYKRTVDQIPDTYMGRGVRTPLLQRLRVLLASPEVRSILKDAIEAALSESGALNEKTVAFVDRCAGARVLPFLVEGIAVMKKVRDDDLVASRLRDGPSLDGIDKVYEKVVMALGKYPMFLEALQTKMSTDANDAYWIKHGGTSSPTSVSITLTTSNYGLLPGSITGATPTSPNDYKYALAAALCRLLYDPSPVDAKAFFGRS
jgi:hypothetical protein